ncbi:hypothetical protein N658DRAFT_524004 [Parathielavia hyrcaniae]|uniref:Uncharacterized protein n=1 Tax=Parathielavia hyrcaniae TaxID=113614 RepID=A0AAN6Q4D4_9PEZI|nr:hypothetical protein N658DRAFT_524004 [Parathielavia hyrcaniae]
MQHRANYTREQIPGPRTSGKPHKGPARLAEGQFDPDELARRLYLVLAEQKAHAQRKQRARGEPSTRKHGPGRSSGTRHRDSARPGEEARQPKPGEPPAADPVTDLRRSESAKRETPHPAPAPDAAAAKPEAYHHVPQEAAKQFARTTTIENMRSNIDHVHKLSKRALMFHIEGPSKTVRAAGPAGAPKPALSPAELTRALQQNQAQRAQHLDRNQFQRTRILQEAARLDHSQQQQHPHQSPHKHTFQDELSRILPHNNTHNNNNSKLARRNSTGTDPFQPTTHDASSSSTASQLQYNRRSLLLLPSDNRNSLTLDPLLEDATPPPEDLSRFPPADRARVDWTQSDEPHGGGGGSRGGGGGGGPKLTLFSPLLRKADSLWAMRGRRGSRDSSGSGSGSGGGGGKGGEKGEGARGGEAEDGGGGESPTAKAGKGFFGRFKR